MKSVLSEYAEQLSAEAKKKYRVKLAEIFCAVNPYIDNDFHYSELL